MVKYEHAEIFESLLSEYEHVPTSRRVLDSMVRFEDMYRIPRGNRDPLGMMSEFIDAFGIKETAQMKRAQIYNAQKDLIKVVDGKFGKSLVLTSKGHKVYFQHYPLAKLREQPWDENWTIVSYDLPTTQEHNLLRDRLRNNLNKFGFGQLHQSLMVSPLHLEQPIQAYIEGERLEEFTIVLRSKRVLGLSNQEIAERTYGLEKFHHLYDELNLTFEQAKQNNTELKKWRLYFLATDNADPQLPNELLLEDWPAKETSGKFKSSFTLLEKIFGSSI